MSGVRYVTIDENHDGQRIDNFLMGMLDVPKSRVYQMIRKGEVRINKKRAKPSTRIQAGDDVRIPPVSETHETIKPVLNRDSKDLLKAVLFENDQVIVLNKPAGLAVHGGTGINSGLIEQLRLLKPECQFLELVHRLDRGTSGCILIAKTRKALLSLHEQLREGQVKKVYAALVFGHWPKRLNRVELKLEKINSENGHHVRVSSAGKDSISTFQVKEVFAESTLLEVHLQTGRTHQIRVQCAHEQYPIIGDDKYGQYAANHQFAKRGIKRMCLHSHRVEFSLPGQPDRFKVEAPIPMQFFLS